MGNADLSFSAELEEAIKGMVEQNKPIGALCISPVILAKVLGAVRLTIGDDEGTVKAVESAGATHVQTTHGQVVVDSKFKVVTTPCYMLDANIAQVADGANNVVKAMMELMG